MGFGIQVNYESSSDEEDSSENQLKQNGVSKSNNGLVDLEDLGGMVLTARKTMNNEPKEMITEELRSSLTKQGYKLVGTHSGVKLCRWTKVIYHCFFFFQKEGTVHNGGHFLSQSPC